MHLHPALLEGGHKGRVTGQDAEVTLRAWRIHLIHLARKEFAFWRDEGEMQL
jgi:hypothetical protein